MSLADTGFFAVLRRDPSSAFMMRNWIGITIFLGVVIAGCVIGPTVEERTRPETADDFIAYVQEDIEAHDWQSILSSSDPELYQERVVEEGIPEQQYVAELLGLLRQGNTIQEGDTLQWADLNRIELATLMPVGDEQPPYRYTGQVTLLEGAGTLELQAHVTQVQGRFVLTSPTR